MLVLGKLSVKAIDHRCTLILSHSLIGLLAVCKTPKDDNCITLAIKVRPFYT